MKLITKKIFEATIFGSITYFIILLIQYFYSLDKFGGFSIGFPLKFYTCFQVGNNEFLNSGVNQKGFFLNIAFGFFLILSSYFLKSLLTKKTN